MKVVGCGLGMGLELRRRGQWYGSVGVGVLASSIGIGTMQAVLSSSLGISRQTLNTIRSSASKSVVIGRPIFQSMQGALPVIVKTYRHYHLPAHMPLPNPPTLPKPPAATPTGLFLTVPCILTPSTTFSSPVSTTTPPTIISPNVACSVSKLKIRSSSHTFSKRRSSACTKTWMRSRSASGDSVDVLIRMK